MRPKVKIDDDVKSVLAQSVKKREYEPTTYKESFKKKSNRDYLYRSDEKLFNALEIQRLKYVPTEDQKEEPISMFQARNKIMQAIHFPQRAEEIFTSD